MFMGSNSDTISYQCQYEYVFDLKNTLAYAYCMSDLRANLQKAMDQKKWNAYDLERFSGVPQPTMKNKRRNLGRRESDKNVVC